MRDAGIVSDETHAAAQPTGDLDQRTCGTKFKARRGQYPRESREAVALGFATDEEDLKRRLGDEPLEQFGPSGLRPVLLFAAAAGMESKSVGSGRRRIEAKTRDRVRIEDGQAFERFQKNFGGMDSRALVGPVRTGDELGARTAGHIRLEDAIGVVEKREDDGEGVEVIYEKSVQA